MSQASSTYRRLGFAAVLACVCASGTARAQQPQQAGSPQLAPDLAMARSALDKYKDPIVAVHDGYFSTVGCIEYPTGGGEGLMAYKAGGMGVHFLNLQLIGPTLAPDKPQVLIYEPVGNALRLVAAEWFVPVPVAGAQQPRIFGRELEGPMVGHKPIMPEGLHHFDLHVWLWKDNPNGIFHPTNSTVKCPPASYTFQEDAPKMAPHPHKP